MKEYPLVSCVMPTADRLDFTAGAVRCFLAQDYPNKELIVFDSGSKSQEWKREKAVTVYPYINTKWIGCDAGLNLGMLRNCANMSARGKYIAHFDDDDYSAPNRLMRQVGALEYNHADICGMPRLLFHDLIDNSNWIYERGPQSWLAGGTLVYRRDVWEKIKFPNMQIGSDYQWLLLQYQSKKIALDDLTLYVAMIHGRNTSPKQKVPPYWKPWKGVIPQHIVQRGPVVY